MKSLRPSLPPSLLSSLLPLPHPQLRLDVCSTLGAWKIYRCLKSEAEELMEKRWIMLMGSGPGGAFGLETSERGDCWQRAEITAYASCLRASVFKGKKKHLLLIDSREEVLINWLFFCPVLLQLPFAFSGSADYEPHASMI